MLPVSIFKITLKNKGCNFHSVPNLSINHIRNFFSETRIYVAEETKKQTKVTVFISVINQLDAKNVCFTISLFHVSTCFEHMCSYQEVKIALHSLWYHHTYRWPSLNLCTRRPPIGVMIPEAVQCNSDLLMTSTCARNM